MRQASVKFCVASAWAEGRKITRPLVQQFKESRMQKILFATDDTLLQHTNSDQTFAMPCAPYHSASTTLAAPVI